MITVFAKQGSGRLLLEEMRLPYRLRDVDLLAGVENDAEFGREPAGFIPAIQDGDVTMSSRSDHGVPDGRYWRRRLRLNPAIRLFRYQQFLHLVAGLAASITSYPVPQSGA